MSASAAFVGVVRAGRDGNPSQRRAARIMFLGALGFAVFAFALALIFGT